MPTGATAALMISNGRRGKVMIPDSFMYGLEWTKKSDKKFDDCAWTKTRSGRMHAAAAATRPLQDTSSLQRQPRILTATQSNEVWTQMQGQILASDFEGGGWSFKPLSAKPGKQLPPPSQRERPPTHKEVLSAVKTLENYLSAADMRSTARSRAEQQDTDRSSASTLNSKKGSARSLGARQGAPSMPSTTRVRPESALGLVSESGDSMVLSLEKGWALAGTTARSGTRRSGRQHLGTLAMLRSKNECVACEAESPERRGGPVVAKTRIGPGVDFAAPDEKNRAATRRTATTSITAKTTMRSQHGRDGDPLMDELFHRLETRAKVDRERQLHSRAQSRNARAHTSLGFREGQKLPGYDHEDGVAYGSMSRLNPAVPSLDLRRIR